MRYRELEEIELTEFFLSEPELAEQALSDEELASLYGVHQKYSAAESSVYMGLIDDSNEVIAVLQWETFTQIAVVIHVRLRTKLQGTGKVKEIFLFIVDFFTKLNMKNIISFAPESCHRASKALTKLGFTEQCMIPNAIVWRQRVEGLYMYNYEITGDLCQQLVR